jgi:inosine/xanthosine triphosphatase
VNFSWLCRYNLLSVFATMEKIIIAVGSKRGPKLNAVQEALAQFSSLLASEAEFEVVGFEVESGVGHTPSSCKELMRGARQRAEALQARAREQGAKWNYFVGLEGGLDVIELDVSPSHGQEDWPRSRRVFLESWAFVSDGARGFYGRSGGIELPGPLAHEVLANRVELAVAIDQFAGAVGIRDAQGAWGVLSTSLISRQEAFRVAVIAAFAPFYNAKMYREGVTATHSA